MTVSNNEQVNKRNGNNNIGKRNSETTLDMENKAYKDTSAFWMCLRMDVEISLQGNDGFQATRCCELLGVFLFTVDLTDTHDE